MDNDAKNKDVYLELLNDIKAKQEDTQESVVKLDKKVDLHIQKTEFELSAINRLDEHQNQLLDEHIAGVKTLKELYEQHEVEDERRFAAIEAPKPTRIWLDVTLKGIGLLSTIAGFIYVLMNIFMGV